MVGCDVVFLFVLHAMSRPRIRIYNLKRTLVLFKAPVRDIAGRTEIATCIKYHEDLCGKALDTVTFGGVIVLISSSDPSRQLLQFFSRLAIFTSLIERSAWVLSSFTQIQRRIQDFS